jgi:peptide subunit release factor 1 (eRF1)
VAATISDISTVLREVQARSERDVEAEKVDLLIEGRHGKTIVGIGGTLEALAALRVSELVYAEGVSIRGALCENCGVIVTDGSKCPKCQVVLPAAEDALDLIIGGALETGAAVEQVRGAAARKLSAVGGIGAFLRY